MDTHPHRALSWCSLPYLLCTAAALIPTSGLGMRLETCDTFLSKYSRGSVNCARLRSAYKAEANLVEVVRLNPNRVQEERIFAHVITLIGVCHVQVAQQRRCYGRWTVCVRATFNRSVSWRRCAYMLCQSTVLI
jgi:hypothetical protein